mmetsp:Transcript_90661/g.234080  ORF Transcript_90661/g.234080 Transcript_90661/m.234080 type:complete len:218 (+) Transcript_90661:658-1311(+)
MGSRSQRCAPHLPVIIRHALANDLICHAQDSRAVLPLLQVHSPSTCHRTLQRGDVLCLERLAQLLQRLASLLIQMAARCRPSPSYNDHARQVHNEDEGESACQLPAYVEPASVEAHDDAGQERAHDVPEDIPHGHLSACGNAASVFRYHLDIDAAERRHTSVLCCVDAENAQPGPVEPHVAPLARVIVLGVLLTVEEANAHNARDCRNSLEGPDGLQ